MTPDQVKLVQQTWQTIAPKAAVAAGVFYARLFEADPSARQLFDPAAMSAQGHKLAQALAMAVKGLDDLGAVAPDLARLGVRHAGYGVLDHHYDTVGEALLWTLEQALGTTWTEEAELAWSAAYGLVAGVMRDAAGTARA